MARPAAFKERRWLDAQMPVFSVEYDLETGEECTQDWRRFRAVPVRARQMCASAGIPVCSAVMLYWPGRFEMAFWHYDLGAELTESEWRLLHLTVEKAARLEGWSVAYIEPGVVSCEVAA